MKNLFCDSLGLCTNSVKTIPCYFISYRKKEIGNENYQASLEWTEESQWRPTKMTTQQCHQKTTMKSGAREGQMIVLKLGTVKKQKF